jgi:S-(hydroxymethyl)glutathione dehydrogenase/alcohol dehydrogenase
MHKFKAAILEKLNSPLAIKEISCESPSLGQVFVKVLSSGLCGAQLQEIAGLKGNANFLPHLLGHEGCGIVEEIGQGVTKVKVGDKVVMHWKKADGFEASFPTYWDGDTKVGGGKITTLSEYALVSENRLTVVDDETPNDLCALLGCGLSTALGTINYEADLKFGESVLILGSGGLGLNLIQASKMAGAFPITVLDIFDKSELAYKLGADNFVNDTNNILNNKYDVIVDTTGNAGLIKTSVQLLNDRGRFIFVGQNKPGESLELVNSNHLFGSEGKTIKATQGGDINPSRDIKRYAKLHKSSYLDLDNIITHRFTFDDINEAFDLLKSGYAGRIIINMSQE